MAKRKVLIITYYWPPSSGVGVQRWMNFAINLQKMDWQPVIYTPSNPQFDIHDEQLLEEVSHIKVIKRPIWEPFNIFHRLTGNKNKENVKQGLVLEKSTKSWVDNLMVWIRGNLFVPDPRVFWVNSSVKFLNSFLQKESIDLVVTTGPPHSIHLIGLGLKEKNPRLKWVSDFRDPWSDWDVLPKLKVSSLMMMRHRKLERKVLKFSNKVLTVSQRLADSLQEKEPSSDIIVLPNGISDARIQHQSASKKQEKFVISYFGMLNEIRDPEVLWKLLEDLCEKNSEFHKKLEIRIGGIVAQSIQRRLETSAYLGDRTVFLGYLSHDEVFEEYQKASILLLLLNRSDNAKWILPMKFFEYLSVAKPILSLGLEDSELGEIFKKYPVGEMCDFDNTQQINNFILSNFEGQFEVDMESVKALLNQYSRTRQSEELAELLAAL